MKSLFGRIHIGKLPSEQQRHQDLLKLLRKIMATQAEIAAELIATKDRLIAATTKIGKISTETDTLLQRITVLEEALANQTGVTPELQAAFDGVKEQVGVVETALTAADDKVPDATPPPA